MTKLIQNNAARSQARTWPDSSYGFELGYEPIVQVVGGSAVDYEQQDLVQRATSGAQVFTYGQALVTAAQPFALDRGLSFESKTLSVATVNATSGLLNSVGAGTARIVARTPYTLRRVDVPVAYDPGGLGIAPVGRVAGCLADHCDQAVDDAIDGLSFATNAPIYTNLAARERNANCWLTLAGIDATCIDADKPTATCIHALYGLQVNHFRDSQDIYVAADNTVHTRTVVDRRFIGPDTSIVKYDSPLPGTITPALLLPDNAAGYLPNISATNTVAVFITDQEKNALVADLTFRNIGGTARPPEDLQRQEFHEITVNGDSGSPCFLIIDGALVLIGPLSTASPVMRSYSSANRALVQAAVDEMDGGAGSTIATVDLSGFPNYSAHNLLTKTVEMSSPWQGSSISYTPGQPSPDGQNTAVLVASTAAGAFNTARYDWGSVAGNSETCTQSVYLKAGTSSVCTFSMFNDSGGGHKARADLNLTTGELTNVTGTVSVIDAGDGWWRIIGTGVPRTNGSDGVRFLLYPNVAGSVASGNNVLAWQPQVNKGSSPMGYEAKS